jgi:hypothetical protein
MPVSVRVAMVMRTLDLIEAGGHLWVYLNWALGLRDLGCRVHLLEQLAPGVATGGDVGDRLARLAGRLAPFDLGTSLSPLAVAGELLPPEVTDGRDVLATCDLVLDVGGKIDALHLPGCRRSALVDIDPGLFQMWVAEQGGGVGAYDAHFTIGETVGRADAPFPDLGVTWHHTPPPVHLPSWPVAPPPGDGPYTTVSSWWGWWEQDGEDVYDNEKRASFMAHLDLPGRVQVRLELALALWDQVEHEDVVRLRAAGWSVAHAFEVANTPARYRDYLRASRGEFSCAKPSCRRLRNAWISDRTLCYLALGRPCVVEHTGPSRFLPDDDGLVRFRDTAGAAAGLAAVEADYDRHARSARALVETHFDAASVIPRVLERALP